MSTPIAPPPVTELERLAAGLAPATEAIAERIVERVLAQEPRLHDPEDPGSADAVRHSTVANVGAILSMLAYGVPGEAIQPSAGALELFERMAARDDGLQVILRGYRVGIAELWQIWAAHVAAHVDDAQLLHQVLAASTSHMLTYIDRMSEQLVRQWPEIRRRRRQGVDVSPDELVRVTLFGPAPPPGALERLGHDASAVHVAVALPPADDERERDRRLSRLRLAGAGAMLTARIGGDDIVWFGWPACPREDERAAVERAVAAAGPVGIGEPHAGLDGFRTTYREAADARRLGMLRDETGVTRYRDVALLAVLCADERRARALARSELGVLAADDASARRLRETLIAYLACGESQVATARRLRVHEKTVAYRIRRAEQLLGRAVGERRAELEAALLVHRAFGA